MNKTIFIKTYVIISFLFRLIAWYNRRELVEKRNVMADVDLKNVKGTLDNLPKEQVIRDYVTKVLSETFETFGY